MVSFIGIANMHRSSVGIRKNSNSCYAHFTTGTHDSDSNFTPVGNQDFVDFTKSVLDVAIANEAKNADELNALELNGRTVADQISDQMGKIGEQIKLGAYEVIEAPKAFAYIHQGNKLATILGLNMADGVDQVGHELAMQVAAMSPVAVDKEDVAQSVIDKEMEIGMDQARQEGKPEAMLERIAMGKLNKFYKAH